MWALNGIFGIFVKEKHYAPGNMVIEVPPTRLGVGNIKYTPSKNNLNFHNASLQNSGLKFTLPVGDIALLAEALDTAGNGSDIQTLFLNTTVLEPKPINLQEGKDVHVDVNFYADGHTFPDTQIFNASFQLLIRAGQAPDMYKAIGSLFSTYNDVANFTMSLTPHSYVKPNELSWLDCVNSINSIVTAMSIQGVEGRWEELNDSIRDDQQVIGRFCIDKGDWTRKDPETVCIREQTNSVSVQ